MDSFQDFFDSILANIYLVGVALLGHISWLTIRVLKFITPRATQTVGNILMKWLIELLTPAISKIIDDKLGSKLDDIEKIKIATHGKTEKEDGVLNRLLEVATKLEEKMETFEKKTNAQQV